MSIVPINQMTEEEVKVHRITRAIVNKKLEGHFRMEVAITDGRINLKGPSATIELE